MDPLITICVTSFNRPALLREALESCLAQAHRPLEIIVGDDSARDNRGALDGLRFGDGVAFTYNHNVPALGEANNVDRLFRLAKGARVLLLHDDDLLCEGGLDRLDRAWREHPGARCVFGKYLIIDQAGTALPSRTQEQNAKYSRTAAHEGRQACGARVGLQQQFPHNGYLVDAGLARQVGYRPRDVVGLCADFDFGIRVGAAVGAGEMVYVDSFVSKYRLSFPSTLRGNPNLGEHLLFRSIQNMSFDAEAEPHREQALNRMAPGANLSAALSRDWGFFAWMLLSRFYRRHVFSGRTLLCLAALVSPPLATRIWLRRQGREDPGPPPEAAPAPVARPRVPSADRG